MVAIKLLNILEGKMKNLMVIDIPKSVDKRRIEELKFLLNKELGYELTDDLSDLEAQVEITDYSYRNNEYNIKVVIEDNNKRVDITDYIKEDILDKLVEDILFIYKD